MYTLLKTFWYFSSPPALSRALDQPRNRILNLLIRQTLERLGLFLTKLCITLARILCFGGCGGISWEHGVVPYRAYTLGKVPEASRIMMGVEGLFFFIVG